VSFKDDVFSSPELTKTIAHRQSGLSASYDHRLNPFHDL
jgi:hypothetical protein